MNTKPETAEELARRIYIHADCQNGNRFIASVSPLIAERDAAHAERIRELEERVAELEGKLKEAVRRGVHGESLATERATWAEQESELRAYIAHQESSIQGMTSGLAASMEQLIEAECQAESERGRIASLEAQLASAPRWIPAVEARDPGRYAVTFECGDSDICDFDGSKWRALHGYALKAPWRPVLCLGPLPKASAASLYEVLDGSGAVVARLDDANPRNCRGGDETCGGCDRCLLQQADHAGMTVRRASDAR